MRKTIKESDIRKIIRYELIKEQKASEENKEDNNMNSMFDNYIDIAIERSGQDALNIDDNLKKCLKHVLHLFMIGLSSNRSGTSGKLKLSGKSLSNLSQQVVDCCENTQQLNLIINHLKSKINSNKK